MVSVCVVRSDITANSVNRVDIPSDTGQEEGFQVDSRVPTGIAICAAPDLAS